MKTDSQIQQDLMEELKWEPFLRDEEIGVTVKNGVAILSGKVDSYAKKMAAERAARKVAGVKAIAEDIQIDVSPAISRSDAEIAEAVVNALKGHSALQEDKLRIKVEDAIVKLEGEVEWEYQRSSAKQAIENLAGIRSVINMITVKPKVSPSDIKDKISAAFHRSATIDAGKITVEVSGSRITLRGKVRSFAEKEDAEQAAWSAPGVISVESFLDLEEPEFELED